jgi:predicted transcriptional regulator
MTTNLKALLERVESWPEAAQSELLAVATQEELQIIDAAMASIDAGESVSPAEIKALFARYRQA